MKTYSQPAIIWPAKYTPGETDNYVSNEVIVKGLSVADVLPYLADTKAWGNLLSQCGKYRGVRRFNH
ncbi:hypothetical protein [Neisseria sicca]|uniref:hypothetical protein n=1 Tax=Neisseria sicca TaxID=490 RepID=UPI003C78CA75